MISQHLTSTDKIKMLCGFLASPDPTAQRYGAATLARSIRSQTMKRVVAEVGGTRDLLHLLKVSYNVPAASLGVRPHCCCDPDFATHRRCVGCHACAAQPHNGAPLPTDCGQTWYSRACRLRPCWRLGKDAGTPTALAPPRHCFDRSCDVHPQDTAARILKNLATNGANRTLLYKAELRAKQKDWSDARNHANALIASRPKPPGASTVATRPADDLDIITRRPSCLENYRAWVKQIGAADVKYAVELANRKAKWLAEEQRMRLPANTRHFASSQVRPVQATLPGKPAVVHRGPALPRVDETPPPQYGCAWSAVLCGIVWVDARVRRYIMQICASSPALLGTMAQHQLNADEEVLRGLKKRERPLARESLEQGSLEEPSLLSSVSSKHLFQQSSFSSNLSAPNPLHLSQASSSSGVFMRRPATAAARTRVASTHQLVSPADVPENIARTPLSQPLRRKIRWAHLQ